MTMNAISMLNLLIILQCESVKASQKSLYKYKKFLFIGHGYLNVTEYGLSNHS